MYLRPVGETEVKKIGQRVFDPNDRRVIIGKLETF